MGIDTWVEIGLFAIGAFATGISLYVKHILSLIEDLEKDLDNFKRKTSEDTYFFERDMGRDLAALEKDLMHQVLLLTEKKIETESNNRDLFYNTTIGKHRRVLGILNAQLRSITRVLNARWTHYKTTLTAIETHLQENSNYVSERSYLPSKDETELNINLPDPEDSFE